MKLSFLKIPKVQLILTLFAIYLSTLPQSNLAKSWYILPLCVGFTVFFDLLFTFLKSKKFFLPLSALVTGLIIVLIVDPSARWYQLAIICALSMGFKNFVRFDGRHIFNPAAIGLFLGGVIFNLGVSWWGASFQVIQPHYWSITAFLILLLPSYISFYRMRRFGSILSFLLIYNIFSSFKLIFDPTTIFFALVMLPEPMTSPFNLKRQILYGIIVAAAALVLSYLPIFPDALIPALLLGNLFQFFFK